MSYADYLIFIWGMVRAQVADSLVWIEKFLAGQVKTTVLGEAGTTVRLHIKYRFGNSI